MLGAPALKATCCMSWTRWTSNSMHCLAIEYVEASNGKSFTFDAFVYSTFIFFGNSEIFLLGLNLVFFEQRIVTLCPCSNNSLIIDRVLFSAPPA